MRERTSRGSRRDRVAQAFRVVAALAILAASLGLAAPGWAAAVGASAEGPQGAPPPRWLDAAAEKGDAPRLAVFNPDLSNLRALATLRRNGALDVPGLVVVGVYHARQAASFAEARKYAAENGLDWVEFHEVQAPVAEADLFKKNAWTPEFELIARKADGVIFFGGPDIPPSVFGEKTLLLTEITDPWRHFFEVSAAFHLLGGDQDPRAAALLEGRPSVPVLGICLGFQTLNVGTGGSLVQDIWWELYARRTVEDVIALGPERWHNNPFRLLHPQERLIGYNFHTIELLPWSVFVKDMGFRTGDHPRILSSHHQAIERLGRGLVVAARSRDGRVIEAVEHRRFANVLGVQFHPEHYLLFDAEPRHRQRPGDELTSFRAILEGTPPSLEFNRAIWGWLGRKLVEAWGERGGGAEAGAGKAGGADKAVR